MEYGAGLYMTTSRNVAERYAKGSRKLYVIELDPNLVFLNDVKKHSNEIINDFSNILKGATFKKFKNIIEDYETIDLNIVNNILVNHKMIKPSNVGEITSYFIKNGVDGVEDFNTFGFGERQIVLFNTSKILNHYPISPSDEKYHKDF